MFRIVEIFQRHRLVVRGVGADKDQKIGPDPIPIGASSGGAADRLLERRRARRMANARAGVHVIGAEETGHFLMGVISLVGEAAGGEELHVEHAEG